MSMAIPDQRVSRIGSVYSKDSGDDEACGGCVVAQRNKGMHRYTTMTLAVLTQFTGRGESSVLADNL